MPCCRRLLAAPSAAPIVPGSAILYHPPPAAAAGFSRGEGEAMAWPNRGLAHRPVVMGRRGMVSSAHPLASLAGLRMLMQGGNAVDAAVATAAALNVCEPYMSGIGGVGYMLIYTPGERRLRVPDYNRPAPGAAT